VTSTFDQLTDAEKAALEVWQSGSADTTGMLCAVRAAVRHTERSLEMSEDFRIAALEKAVQEIAGMLDRFDTFGDAGRTRMFVGDLAQILSRIP
jgi:hypothetical protein